MITKDYGCYVVTEVEVGDKIHAQGCTFEIAKIISQIDYSDVTLDDGMYVEFEDPNGNYHYWKQYQDGGYVIDKFNG